MQSDYQRVETDKQECRWKWGMPRLKWEDSVKWDFSKWEKGEGEEAAMSNGE